MWKSAWTDSFLRSVISQSKCHWIQCYKLHWCCVVMQLRGQISTAWKCSYVWKPTLKLIVYSKCQCQTLHVCLRSSCKNVVVFFVENCSTGQLPGRTKYLDRKFWGSIETDFSPAWKNAAVSFIWMESANAEGLVKKSAGLSGKKVKPGSAFATTQCDIIWQEATPASDIHASSHSWYFVKSIFLLLTQLVLWSLLQKIILLPLSWVVKLSLIIINQCALIFTDLWSPDSHWSVAQTSWIVFYISLVPEATPPHQCSPLHGFNAGLMLVWMPAKTTPGTYFTFPLFIHKLLSVPESYFLQKMGTCSFLVEFQS